MCCSLCVYISNLHRERDCLSLLWKQTQILSVYETLTDTISCKTSQHLIGFKPPPPTSFLSVCTESKSGIAYTRPNICFGLRKHLEHSGKPPAHIHTDWWEYFAFEGVKGVFSMRLIKLCELSVLSTSESYLSKAVCFITSSFPRECSSQVSEL